MVFLSCCPNPSSSFLLLRHPSPPFLHMPLDFKDLEGVGIDAELVALTGVEPAARGGRECRIEVSFLLKHKGYAQSHMSPAIRWVFCEQVTRYPYAFAELRTAISGNMQRTLQTFTGMMKKSGNERCRGAVNSSKLSTPQCFLVVPDN